MERRPAAAARRCPAGPAVAAAVDRRPELHRRAATDPLPLAAVGWRADVSAGGAETAARPRARPRRPPGADEGRSPTARPVRPPGGLRRPRHLTGRLWPVTSGERRIGAGVCRDDGSV